MSVAAVDGGCSIATCDGIWVRAGVSPVRTNDVADHYMGLGRGEAASAGYAWVLVLDIGGKRKLVRRNRSEWGVTLRKNEGE